ncbi:MAG: phosphatidate cytidylyltransferase, partial [Inquilinus sp.]|nr:phosphatidate cytidylyltransferase [Inquilinus sp.]
MPLIDVAPTILWALAAVFGVLLVASAIVFVLIRAKPDRDFGELVLRVRSWWVMVAVFAIAIVLSPVTSLVFLGFVSFLALKEFVSMVPTRRADRKVLFWAYLAIPLQYVWVGQEWYGMFIIFVPVYMFLLLPTLMVIRGETTGFLKAAGTLHWGMMTCVFAISHAGYLLVLRGDTPAGGAGLLLFLVFLTQANDVAQYVWGRLFGRHKAAPTVSPNKTVEGYVGGFVTTGLLAVAIAPWLTPMDWPHALVGGLIIGFAGFMGDVTVSAVKRDIGVKDTGALLPGHGGILDRIDSLTFT